MQPTVLNFKNLVCIKTKNAKQKYKDYIENWQWNIHQLFPVLAVLCDVFD